MKLQEYSTDYKVAEPLIAQLMERKSPLDTDSIAIFMATYLWVSLDLKGQNTILDKLSRGIKIKETK